MKNYFGDTRLQVVGGLLVIGAAIVLGLSGFKLPSQSNSTTNTSSMPKNTSDYQFPGRLTDEQIQNKQARMVTSRGEIILALDPAQAPLAVSNFVSLTESGFYDGIIWHRVEDWVVQAGDPQTKDASVAPIQWGTGGPGYKFPDEPVTGQYLTGVLAMANSGPNTNGSQFFILKRDYPLPPNYTIFGRVTAGLETVLGLVKGDRIERVTIEPVAS